MDDHVFTFPVHIIAESYTDAVSKFKEWRGGELNDNEDIVVSSATMGDMIPAVPDFMVGPDGE